MAKNGARTYLKTHRLSGKQLLFRLNEEREALLERAKESRTGRTAKTLVKEGPLRITLVAMRKGARMMRHHVDGPASVHVLSGRLTVDADGKGTELPAGGVVVFDEGIEHDVGARTDCSFLITIAWRD